jgi:hypothetical protein
MKQNPFVICKIITIAQEYYPIPDKEFKICFIFQEPYPACPENNGPEYFRAIIFK